MKGAGNVEEGIVLVLGRGLVRAKGSTRRLLEVERRS
jgi:hypothetical protein